MSAYAASAPPSLPVDIRLMNALANALFALVGAALLVAGLMWLARLPVFAIRAIKLEGDLSRNSVSTIRANAAPKLAGNFFTIDLAKTRAAFESVPWVRRAVVHRVWPGALRVQLLEHKPASMQPFDTVSDEIRKRLVEEEAQKRAEVEGRAILEKLRKGEAASVPWSKPVSVGRSDPHGLSENVLRESFRLDASSVPAYSGVPEPKQGFQLIRVSKVSEPTEIKPEMRKSAADQLGRLVAQEQLAGYLEALKQELEVKVQPDLIEKQQQ